jgi:hypothetical protein
MRLKFMMKVLQRAFITSLPIMLLLVLACSSSFADTSATYQLTLASSELGGGTDDFGTVDLALVSDSIQVTVTGLNGWEFFGTSLAPIFGFNLAGDVAGLQITSCGVCASPSFNLNDSLDGFGVFGVTVNDGIFLFPHSSFSFKVTRTGGFSDVNSIYSANDKGLVFAAHAIKGVGGGYAGLSVPEPSILLSLGSGLAGLGLYWSRRRR